MNTTNVMTVQPQAGAQAKAQGTAANTAKAAKSVKSGNASYKQSFDETMGKLENDADSAAAAKDMQESTADRGGTMDDAPQDPLASVLAALQQGNEALQAEAEPVLPDNETPAAVLAMSAEVQDIAVSDAANEKTAAAETNTAGQTDLRSLIPQSAEDNAKSRDFLAMLSGQQLKYAGTKGQEQAQTATAMESRPQQAATMLEAQLLSKQNPAGMIVQVQPQESLPGMNNRQTETLPNVSPQMQGQTEILPDANLQMQPQNLQGNLQSQGQSGKLPDMNEQMQPQTENLQTQQSENLPDMDRQAQLLQSAETVSQPAVLQTMIRPQAVQAPVSSSAGQKPEQGILDGINLSMETEEEMPAMPLRMDARQAMNQQNPQTGQQSTAQQELAETMAARMQPLAEENAAEQAPASGSNTTSQNNGAVSMFQQALQDSITGPAGSKDAQAPQPQTDFDIPRQIVDQARLIRRAEDTQMVIKLNPEHLGELTLKVSVTQNGSVNAAFHSDNAQVRAIIENSLVQLRQELNDQGLKVDSVEVYAGLADGQLPQEQGQQAWQNQQGGRNGGSSIRGIAAGAEEYAEEADGLAAAAVQEAGKSAMDGVDYRI